MMKTRLIIFVLLLVSWAARAQTSDATLKTQSTIIKDEVIPVRNTALRVGTNLLGIVNSKTSRVEPYVAGGVANTYTIYLDWFTGYTLGLHFIIQFPVANTGASTININGAGAKNLLNVASALSSGDIPANSAKELWYDGTNFQVTNITGGGGGGGFSDPMTTRGDLIYRNSSNVTARLGAGTASQVLTSDGTDISWQTPSGGSFTVASLSEAQAETDNTKGMTPLRVGSVSEKVFRPEAYGAVGDGTTDNTTAINNCLAAMYTAGGGIMQFGLGTFRANGQILIPNDGTSLQPVNRGMTIRGSGNYSTSQQHLVSLQGGTVLDLRYENTAQDGKILTKGFGWLRIENLTILTLGSTFVTPFLMTTNTRLDIDRVSFMGNPAVATSTSCTQDCIVFGGTGTVTNNTNTSPFQGYGSSVTNCFFNHVRRVVIGQNYFNGFNFKDNWLMVGSGGSEAFKITGDVTNSSGGHVYEGNVIEAENYTYIWNLDKCVNFAFTDNSTYDNLYGTCIGLVFNSATSQNHYWKDGGNQVPGVPVFVGSNPTLNRYETSSSNADNIMPNNIVSYGLVTLKSNNGLRQQRNGTGEIWFRNTDGTDNISDYIDRTPIGGGVEGIGVLSRSSATASKYVYSKADHAIEGSGILRLWSAAGNLLLFGDASSGVTNYLLNNTWYNNDATGHRLSSSTGINWTNGAANAALDTRIERQSARRLRITDGASAVGSLSSTFINPALFANDAAADAGFVGATAPDGTIYSNSSTGAPRAKISGTWAGFPTGSGTSTGTNTGDQSLANTSDATSHTVTLTGGTSVQLIEGSNITLTTGGTGGVGTVTIASTGGGGTPAGSNTEIQFNNSGSFGASPTLTFNTTSGLASTKNANFTSIGSGSGGSFILDATYSGINIDGVNGKITYTAYGAAGQSNLFTRTTNGGSVVDIYDSPTTGSSDKLFKIRDFASDILSITGSGILTLGGGSTAPEFRILEASGSGTNYVGFKSPALAGNTVYDLPNAFPAVSGYVLSSTTGGVMSWVAAGGGGGLTYAQTKAIAMKIK